MVDLKQKPFYLSDEDIRWVEETIASMTDEEKIGQLFIMLDRKKDFDETKEIFDRFHIGGCRYSNEPAEKIYEQNRFYQEHSKIPVLIACNCDNGGDGACGGGTYVATAAACGATDDDSTAYSVGYVSGREAAAVGCNWDFGPVCDLLYNWRNTIVNTRAYGKDPELVIKNAKAYVRGVRESGLAVCCKHFPGDGIEELDQHLVMGVNTMECDEWDSTFGHVYKEMIDSGIQSIMAGHIALPEYSRKLRPGIKDEDIMPATLAPELITDLLRGKLGFNGLVLTDASHMAGMTAAMPRSQQVPGAIAAGCDMFLFFNDIEEDFGYMMAGYKNGIITEERMQDALRRILGVKASIGLHKKAAAGTLTPPKEGISVVGCDEHKAIATECADKFITLVKDTQNMLPLNPEKQKRVRIHFMESEGRVLAGKLVKDDNGAKLKELIIQTLTKKGFEVEDGDQLSVRGKMDEFSKNVDAVLVFIDQVGFAQYNSMRLKWTSFIQQPWYVAEVPTCFISLYLPNYLIDLTMSHTYINCYQDNPEVIEPLIEKLCGESEFKGKPEENVWCGRWDTKL